MERVPVISEIADVIDSRKGGDPKVSYVAKLFSKAPDAALKKVGEEATEVVMAAKDGDRDHLIYETADLWFHSMVVLSQAGIRPEEVLQELARREGTSGLVEKANRKESLERVNNNPKVGLSILSQRLNSLKI